MSKYCYRIPTVTLFISHFNIYIVFNMVTRAISYIKLIIGKGLDMVYGIVKHV